MVGRNSSKVANEILVRWLREKGKGREIFDDVKTVEADSDDPSGEVTDSQEQSSAA